MCFRRPVSGFVDDSKITFSGIAGTMSAIVTPDPLDPAHYTVSVTGMAGVGDLTISLQAEQLRMSRATTAIPQPAVLSTSTTCRRT